MTRKRWAIFQHIFVRGDVLKTWKAGCRLFKCLTEGRQTVHRGVRGDAGGVGSVFLERSLPWQIDFQREVDLPCPCHMTLLLFRLKLIRRQRIYFSFLYEQSNFHHIHFLTRKIQCLIEESLNGKSMLNLVRMWFPWIVGYLLS